MRVQENKTTERQMQRGRPGPKKGSVQRACRAGVATGGVECLEWRKAGVQQAMNSHATADRGHDTNEKRHGEAGSPNSVAPRHELAECPAPGDGAERQAA